MTKEELNDLRDLVASLLNECYIVLFLIRGAKQNPEIENWLPTPLEEMQVKIQEIIDRFCVEES